jgi:hypothetical protein
MILHAKMRASRHSSAFLRELCVCVVCVCVCVWVSVCERDRGREAECVCLYFPLFSCLFVYRECLHECWIFGISFLSNHLPTSKYSKEVCNSVTISYSCRHSCTPHLCPTRSHRRYKTFPHYSQTHTHFFTVRAIHMYRASVISKLWRNPNSRSSSANTRTSSLRLNTIFQIGI